MAFDIGAINLNFYTGFLNIGEESISNGERDWQEPQFVDNNSPFETTVLAPSALPMSPPHSCPVTPTLVTERNFEKQEPEYGQTFLTDTPELEHYLRQTNPLQGKEMKRKYQLLNENNEIDMKKVKKNDQPEHGESSSSIKTIKWSDYKSEEWHKLFSSSLTEPTSPSLFVSCDKGLTFSPAESVFICQKKNHFQVHVYHTISFPNIFSQILPIIFNHRVQFFSLISLNLEITSDSQTLVQVEDVYQSVISYKVHLYAIKAESPHKKITMEQSTADRSKRPYSPVRFPGEPCGTKTLTIGRLHFSETTSNNMRKKGKLNPDQRYFQLVVDVRAYTKQGNYSICSQISEKVIVRASNPGQFENDVALWSKDKNGECVYRMGHVGINTDKPDQCLSVNGNIKLTGQIMTPSDARLTEHLHQANTRENLENISNLKLYRYRYNQAYSYHAGLEQPREDLGVLGNEVKTFIPDAVTESADIVLADGKMVKDILMVKKDRLLMESLGAIQELSKMTKILTSRMIELETKNEILEVVLRNMVSESMNMSILN